MDRSSNKSLMIGAAALLLALSAVGVFAYGMMGNGASGGSTRMRQVLENGTYQDLVSLRQQTGLSLMPWIQDQSTFQQAQAQYRQNEALYGDTGYRGMMGGWGGGCPMMNSYYT